jgi:hypothetical protein
MSHLTTVKTEIRDLAALKDACAELGFEFRENQTCYKWFGNDEAYQGTKWFNEYMATYIPPDGMALEDLGKCLHAVHLPGHKYEIGLLRNTDGNAWRLLYDSWSPDRTLKTSLNKNCNKLVQLYAVHKTMRLARHKGWLATRNTLPNGNVKLTISGNGL